MNTLIERVDLQNNKLYNNEIEAPATKIRKRVNDTDWFLIDDIYIRLLSNEEVFAEACKIHTAD